MLLSRGRPKDSLCINYMTMYYITHLFTRKAYFPKKRQESFKTILSFMAAARPFEAPTDPKASYSIFLAIGRELDVLYELYVQGPLDQ